MSPRFRNQESVSLLSSQMTQNANFYNQNSFVPQITVDDDVSNISNLTIKQLFDKEDATLAVRIIMQILKKNNYNKNKVEAKLKK